VFLLTLPAPYPDGYIFLLNSKHKALFYSRRSKLPVIADDGGLQIDYLNGAPGVKSRRWVNGTDDIGDKEIIDYTLKKLKNVPLNKRGAQLVTVIALVLPGGKIFTATGKIKGVIAKTSCGILTPGFPYRSLLYLPEIKKFYHSRKMTEEEIKRYSHRGKALAKLAKILYKYVINK
ncbi:MAG: hypothetical protein M1120_01565, partial [Patescibacteria group bacterium]|nr:hypothetical protein [Patescibacteria group bacterium]